jgi:hypothetical protein
LDTVRIRFGQRSSPAAPAPGWGDPAATTTTATAGVVVIAAGPAPDPAAADRREAAQILASRRFHPRALPRPLHGVLHWLGGLLSDVLRPVGRWLEPVYRPVGRALAVIAGNRLALAAAGLAVLTVAVWAARGLVRRRVASASAAEEQALVGAREDPDELEGRADAAERDDDLVLAYRLRFRAGVLRLSRSGVLRYEPSLTTGGLADLVRSSRFWHLAHRFDTVAYGGRSVSAGDLADARAEWAAVLDETRVR